MKVISKRIKWMEEVNYNSKKNIMKENSKKTSFMVKENYFMKIKNF